jgi:hypothetical protein
VRIAEDISLLEEKPGHIFEEDDDDDENDRAPLLYYKSKRILGHLFRSIDEVAFLEELQSSSKGPQPPANVLKSIWEYVCAETTGFQWDHHVSTGLGIKEM